MSLSLDTFKDSIPFITFVSGIIVSLYYLCIYRTQEQTKRAENFTNCSKNLFDENETAQITAAILLRGFLKYKRYRPDTINLIVALLRTLQTGNLQKTLADGISYIDSADGQDFQNVNMKNASIKPKARIMYEITSDHRYLRKGISMRCADFYNANLSCSSINNIHAQEAIFQNCMVKNTAFHHCCLRNAVFNQADLENVIFDNCDLVGATFMNAKYLDTVRLRGPMCDKSDKLLDYLNDKGVFNLSNIEHTSGKYIYKVPDRRIFISKLGLMSPAQISYFNDIKDYLIRAYNVTPVYIDRDKYKHDGQLNEINNKLSKCSGLIVLAFSYMDVTEGILHKNSGDDIIANRCYPSPWLHIETALAYNMGLPCLIISEKGTTLNGIFENSIVNCNENMFHIEYGALISDHKATFDQWIALTDNISIKKSN